VSNLLVVDWDYFFPNPWGGPSRPDILMYDWGHRESPFFINVAWHGRAEAFVINDLPLPALSGAEDRFWDRGFQFAKRTRFFYGESNSGVASNGITGKQRRWDHVFLYDAHHDSGYSSDGMAGAVKLLDQSVWSCENWMVLYHFMGAELHVRYPGWKTWALDAEPEPLIPVERQIDKGKVPDVVFDTVFVCKSGAWVPSWHDNAYDRFIDRAPFKVKRDLTPDWGNRNFDLEEVRESAERIKQMMERAS